MPPPSESGGRFCTHRLGSEAGRHHIFKLTVSKAARASEVYTTVTVAKGASPVPVITPLVGKVNAGQKLTLQSTIFAGSANSTVAVDAVSLWWSASPVADSGAGDVDLDNTEDVLASSSRAAGTLVLHPRVLSEGGRYIFRLEAEQGGATGSTSLEVVVNSPPKHGRLEVTPVEGTALQTEFALNTSGWEEEDLPLAASFSYRVIGSNASSGKVSLSSVSPQLVAKVTLPEGGLEEFGSLVEVAVQVEDRFQGEAELVLCNITVMAPSFESEEAKLDYVDAVMDDSEMLLVNGRAADALNAVTGSSSLLAPESNNGDGSAGVQRSGRDAMNKQNPTGSNGEEVELESNATLQRRRQREAMMAVVASAYGVLIPSSTAQSWVAGVVHTLVDCPAEEISQVMREQVLEVYSALVDMGTAEGESGVSMTVQLAQQILDGLSSITPGLEMDGATSSSFAVLQGVGNALLLHLSAGEEPAEAASEHLQLRVQRDSLAEVGGTADRFLDALMSTPGTGPTTQLLLPSTIRDILHAQAGEEIAMRLLVISSDPHSNQSAAAATSSSLENITTGCGDGNGTWMCHHVCSAVTSVSLLHANGTEMTIAGLPDPVELNLTVGRMLGDEAEDKDTEADGAINGRWMPGHDGKPLRCAFWDAEQLQYSSRGCVNLPNPAPRNASLYWREPEMWEEQRNGSAADEAADNAENAFITGSQLQQSHWGMQHPWLLNGCINGSNKLERTSSASSIVNEADAQPTNSNFVTQEDTAWGDACAVLLPGNQAGCTWDQLLQGFVGSGCEWSNVLQCKCSHLTDFVVDMPSVSDGSADPTCYRGHPRATFTSFEYLIITAVAAVDALTFEPEPNSEEVELLSPGDEGDGDGEEEDGQSELDAQ
eukprot:gene5604-6790_t